MTRKVIIDCDPGIDDAVALTLALFDPRLEVVAVTAVAGNIPAEQASRNVEAIIKHLDPPRYPRVGAATAPDNATRLDARHIHGDDGLANTGLATSQLAHRHPSEKVLADTVRQFPDQVTVLCLGPLTNLARAIQRDPSFASLVDHIVIMGGSLNGIGNITPAAEFNVHYDPVSASVVFKSASTKSLIPLDVTQKVVFDMSMIDELPRDSTRAGDLLRRTIPFFFRSYHQMGQEGILLHDAVALMSCLHPELFVSTEMAGDVETAGELTAGATIFDRRTNRQWRHNMDVATEIDAVAVHDGIMRGMKYAGQCT
jgi:purine nucleosidase